MLLYMFKQATYLFCFSTFSPKIVIILPVLISWGCCDKLPHVTCFKTKIYSLTVPETRNLNLRCQQSHAPLKGFTAKSFLIASWLLGVAGNSLAFLGLQVPHLTSASSFPCSSPCWGHGPSCVLSYKDTGHTGFRVCPNPVRLHFNQLCLQWTFLSTHAWVGRDSTKYINVPKNHTGRQEDSK